MTDLKLTKKQEKFAQIVADGKSQAEAFRSAYSWKNYKTVASIHIQASKVAAITKVALRIDELKQELANKNLWTREMAVTNLKNILSGKRTGNKDKISCVKELNMMHGFNIPAGDLDAYVLPVRIVREIVDGSKKKKKGAK